MPTTIAVSSNIGVLTSVSLRQCRDDWPDAVIPATHQPDEAGEQWMSLWPAARWLSHQISKRCTVL